MWFFFLFFRVNYTRRLIKERRDRGEGRNLPREILRLEEVTRRICTRRPISPPLLIRYDFRRIDDALTNALKHVESRRAVRIKYVYLSARLKQKCVSTRFTIDQR